MANASPSAASLSTDLYGQATLNACEEIRKRLEPVARALQESKGGTAPSFKEVAFAAYFQVFSDEICVRLLLFGYCYGLSSVQSSLTVVCPRILKYHISASTCRPTGSTSSRPTAAATTGMCPYLRGRLTASEAPLSTTSRRSEHSSTNDVCIFCVQFVYSV